MKILFVRKCVLPLQRVPNGTSGQRYKNGARITNFKT
nr:MAG TPA: hypothetical protein [Caudoviricetes sp.]